MRSHELKWLCILLLALPCAAQTINAASCSRADVSTALSSITIDGTTVVVPSGDCVWTTQLSYTQVHSFTLQGAGAISGTGLLATIGGIGTDLTTIEDNLGADAAMLVIVTASGKSFRMTGFHIKYYSGNAVVSDTAGVIELAGQSTSVRFDHNHIDELNNVDLYLAGGIQGVIDHNQFDAGFADENQIRYTDPNWSGPSDQLGDGSWADSSHFGTSQFMYVEVNNFQWVPSTTTTCSGADGHAFAFDAGLDGGRGVFRFNAVGFHVALQTHGTSGGTQQHRGLRALEIYKNVLQYTTVTGDCFGQVVQLEGGTQLWWGNTLSGFLQYIHADVVRVHNTTYAETATPNGWGYCGTAQTGTGSAWDQSATGSGYACMDSIGRGGGDLLSGANFPSIVNSTTGTIAWPNQPLEPMYTWASTLNCVPSNPCTYYSNNSSAVLVENQDYYDQLPNQDNGATFDGTAGIGSGTLVGKPGTCTKGVGWWATDQGSWNTSGSGGQGVLYLCSATNTWTSYYTPYTYPHPLDTNTVASNSIGAGVKLARGVTAP